MKTFKILSISFLLFFFCNAKAQLANCPSRIGKSQWTLKNNSKYSEFMRNADNGKRMIYRVYGANTQFSTGLKTAEFIFGDDNNCNYCSYEFSDIKFMNLIVNDINLDLNDFRKTANQNEWRSDNGRYLLDIVPNYQANSFTVVYKGDNYSQ